MSRVSVLQDVMMPDVDGIELLRHLRGNESFAAVPVVSTPLAAPSLCLPPPPPPSLLFPPHP